MSTDPAERAFGPGGDCEETERRLRLLRRVAEDLSADADLARVVAMVAELVVQATHGDVCFVHLVDSDKNRLVLAGATPPFDHLAGTIELGFGEGIAGWVAAHGKPAVVADKWADPRYRYIPELKGEEFDALVSVPMLRRGKTVVGVLNVHWRHRRPSSDAEVALLADVANLLAGTVENTLLYRRLADREAKLAEFAGRTIDSQEQERRRLAADIHDGIGQRVAGLTYHLDAAMAALPPQAEGVRAELVRAMELARSAMSETRDAIEGLRPGILDDLGLAPGLETLARSVALPSVQVHVDAVALQPHLETTLYRICQEALRNVERHAEASSVKVTLRCGAEEVLLSVIDDGVGLASAVAERGHYGIIGMRERAELVGGTFELFSKPDGGTRVVVRIPLNS